MSKIIDLGLLVRDPLIFKDMTGEEYIIPGEVDLGFVIKLSAYQEQIKKLKNDIEALKKTQELVVDILSMDKSKNITIEIVREKFSDIRVLKAIIEHTINFVHEIASDPNSNSLESIKKE